jgi:hypothetical protein
MSDSSIPAFAPVHYGAAAARYIDAFFRNIRWEAVAERLAHAQHATSGRM